MSPDQLHARARRKVRRRPAWLLRRRERRIIASRAPSSAELAELGAIRRTLQVRATRRAPMRWWAV